MSLEAAGLRLVERSGKPAAFLVAGATDEGLRVRYARARDLGLLIPRGEHVAPASGMRERVLALAWPRHQGLEQPGDRHDHGRSSGTLDGT